MIDGLLTPMPRERFMREHFHGAPYAEPGAAAALCPRLTWQTLTPILAAHPAPDIIVVKNGQHLDEPGPTSLDAARQMLSTGRSFVIRAAEAHDPALADLAARFAAELDGPTTIHLFATPPAHHAFGWHFDCEDVFLIQTAGSKEYLLRQNTTYPRPTLATMPRNMSPAFKRERTPIAACTLLAGDWLYIPSGWWHVARCTQTSLSISVGVMSARARGEHTRIG